MFAPVFLGLAAVLCQCFHKSAFDLKKGQADRLDSLLFV
jgi:hypothetical protein